MARFCRLRRGIRLGCILLILASAINPAHAQPIDGTFSYQGRLDVSGFPANGPFDFEAVLFDSLTFGNQIGPILRLDDIDVVEGLVNLQLNFGDDAFNGQQRFLELRVRDVQSGGGFVILDPRQPVLASPYSISTSQVDGDLIQRGTIGTCESDGSTGTSGSVTFPEPFATTPIVFLTVDESFVDAGCTSARIFSRTSLGFGWQSWTGGTYTPCDCIHWMAIGPP